MFQDKCLVAKKPLSIKYRTYFIRYAHRLANNIRFIYSNRFPDRPPLMVKELY